jgi:hypothetical protein
LALALPSNSKTRLERVSKEKCSSLLGLALGNEGKKFYDISSTWPAAKCEQTKQTEVAKYRKRMATVPLFPVAPPIPVLTLSMETSVIWG